MAPSMHTGPSPERSDRPLGAQRIIAARVTNFRGKDPRVERNYLFETRKHFIQDSIYDMDILERCDPQKIRDVVILRFHSYAATFSSRYS